MRSAALVLLLSAAACTSVPTAPQTASDVAVIAPPRRALDAGESLPPLDSVVQLESLVPADATVVIGVPPLGGTADALLGGVGGEMVRRAIAERAHLEPAVVETLVKASAGAVVFRRTDEELGAVVHVREADVAERIAKRLDLRQTGPDSWRGVRRDEQKVSLRIDRFAKAGVVVFTSDDRLRSSVLELAAGKGTRFTRKSAGPAEPSELWVAADLAALRDRPEAMGPGSRVDVSLGPTTLAIDYAQHGAKIPQVGRMVAPGTPAALAGLPDGALGGAAFSIRRAPGKSLADALTEFGKPLELDLGSVAADLLRERGGVTLADVDRALGDEIAFAVYAPEGAKGDAALDALAIVATVDTRDERVAKKLVDAYRRASGKGAAPSRAGGVGARADEKDVELVVDEGRVIIAMGPRNAVAKLAQNARKPARTIGAKATSGWEAAQRGSPLHAHGFVDLAAVASLLPADARPASAPGASDAIRTAKLTLAPSDDGVDLAFRTLGRAGDHAGVDMVAAMAAYGVRRYLESAKVVEAKNTVGAIARGAIAAYERESVSGAALAPNASAAHVVCDSARPVPQSVPKGTTHQPGTAAGADFQSGTDAAGWRCLKFDMVMPHYYQYDYRHGGPYKGPARGGPDPGPGGFEISAEGDLDGDGKTSLFTIVGRIDPKTSVLRLSDLFISEERE